jgi:hypothetical protein
MAQGTLMPALPHIDFANAQTVCIWVLHSFFDFAHHNACERRRNGLKFFDFQACHRQGIGQGLGGNGRVAKFAQPRFWELHLRVFS